MPSRFSLRWVAVSVFIISSTLNYLDRNLLGILAPSILAEMHLTQTGFGLLISIFSVTYAASSLGMGWLLDRFGVNRTISWAVGWWSAAAIGNGLVRAFPGLVVCRAALGIGESAGVPAVGKLNGLYLEPSERALGAAANQVGLSLGAVMMPLWIGVALTYGWRMPFLITGALGLVWVPLWLFVSRSIPARYKSSEFVPPSVAAKRGSLAILRERNMLLLVAANLLWMSGYSLWSNWTTLYLVHVNHLTLAQTARYIWIPPLVSNFGGFFGGWLSFRWMKKAADPVRARRNAVWVSAFCSLLALLLPFAPDAGWATAGISISYFFALAGSVNIYALPIDIYGPARSGLALAALTCAFGVLQTLISPVIGVMGDHNLYGHVVWIATVPLFLSAWTLMGLRAPEPNRIS